MSASYEVLSQNEEGERTWEVKFDHITTSVKLGDGTTRYTLFDVGGSVRPKELFAIMGLSGAGKTTLLQVLGGRNKQQCNGTVKVGPHVGWQLNESVKSQISFVWQDDLFFPSLAYTAHNHIWFCACMRLPSSVPLNGVQAAVNSVIDQLHLQASADISLYYASGGERRRTSVATELLSAPKVLLLDEGTTGLDSAAAYDLLTILQNLAQQRSVPVICTIHQPSTRSFYLFDTVLMLCEGYCVYRGRPADCLSYLASVGYFLPDTLQYSYNPADYFLDLLFSQEPNPVSGMLPRYALMWAWNNHQQQLVASGATAESAQVDAMPTQGDSNSSHSPLTSTDVTAEEGIELMSVMEEGSTIAASTTTLRLHITQKAQGAWWRRFCALFQRSLREHMCMQFCTLNLTLTVSLALLVGLCWFQVPLLEGRVGDLVGFAFFVVAYWFFSGLYQGMLEFLPERAVLHRELQAGDYSLLLCFCAKTCAALPSHLLLPVLFVCISYPMLAVSFSLVVVLQLCGVLVLSSLTGSSIGVLVGTVTSDYHTATSLNTVMSIAMLIVGGFYLQTLPSWLSALAVVDPFGYAYRTGVQVVLGTAETVVCEGGYWLRACVGRAELSGQEVVEAELGKEGDSRMHANIAALVMFWLVFRIFAFLALWRSERGK